MDHLEEVAEALKKANDDLYATLRYNVKDNTWEIWVDGKPKFVNILSHDDAETVYEGINYKYAAKKAIEALKGDAPYYIPISTRINLTSDEIWNLCLDHILKYHIS